MSLIVYKSLAAHPLRMRTAFAMWRGLSPIPIRREPGGVAVLGA